MSGNRFGTLFTYTTFGESHGPAIGCVVDGVPPQIPLTEDDIQPWLDRRKPGQSRFTTQRKEADAVRILSGVFEGKTTGTPIGLLIENTDQRSRDYGEIAQQFRPGHADMTYMAKYGIRDYRGGGRASARETAMRVAAGAIAHKMLSHCIGPQVKIRAALIQMGPHKINRNNWDWAQVSQNPFNCPDAALIDTLTKYLDGIRKDGNSTGAMVELVAEGLPAGLGCPVYDRLDAELAKALMSINAVKGVEIGAGFDAAGLTGAENGDEMCVDDNSPSGIGFKTNNAGGILGGISNGDKIVARFAIKPTSSILIPKESVDINGQPCTVVTKGRHDPCVGIRAVPIAEAMAACVLADHYLRFKAQKP